MDLFRPQGTRQPASDRQDQTLLLLEQPVLIENSIFDTTSVFPTVSPDSAVNRDDNHLMTPPG